MGCDKSGLHFRKPEGNYDVYEYFKGGRAVFEVSVNRTDPNLEIHVGKVGATFCAANKLPVGSIGTLHATGLKARRKKHEDRISGLSVSNYFHTSRAFAVLANLYVPKALNADMADTLTDLPVIDEPAS